MPLFDVYLVPCVTVMVPRITAESMAKAVTQAEDIAKLTKFFDPLNHLLPAGVAWVDWSEECSHAMVDTLPPGGEWGEPIDTHFLNTANEPVVYDHTTGFLLQLLDGQRIHTFGPFRQLDISGGFMRCTPWRATDLPQVFRLTADGLHFRQQVYAHWAVVSVEIPDYFGMPVRLLNEQHLEESHVPTHPTKRHARLDQATRDCRCAANSS